MMTTSSPIDAASSSPCCIEKNMPTIYNVVNVPTTTAAAWRLLYEMLPLRIRFTVTGPAEVSICRSLYKATPAPSVRRSGWTASQSFFF